MDRGGFGGPSLLELVDTPSPASDVRAMLRLYRDRGHPFEDAWSRTLRSLPQAMPGIEEWRSLLHRTKQVWKAAYERPSRPERVAGSEGP
ncbi:MAG: hypothetical protein WD844_11535 [Thermoleophilaceae bacterium]